MTSPSTLSISPRPSDQDTGINWEEKVSRLEAALEEKNLAITELAALLNAGLARPEESNPVDAGEPNGLRLQHDSREQMITNLQQIIKARDEAVAYLRGEVAEGMRRLTKLEKSHTKTTREAEKAQKKFKKTVKELEAQIRRMEKSVFWKARGAIKKAGTIFQPVRALRDRMKRPASSSNTPSLPTNGIPAGTPLANTASLAASSVATPRHPDFALVIQPELSAADHGSILDRPQHEAKPGRADILSFSIIDWEFRYQRPQQVMAAFAAMGHRVFYISVSRFLPADSYPRFEIHELAPNVFEVRLAVERAPSLYGEIVDGENADALLASLRDLRRHFAIETAVSFVTLPSWCDVVAAAKARWGWHVLYDCMDEWDGFDVMHPIIIEAEKKLVENADTLIVTAARLEDKWRKAGHSPVLVRNAVDYAFYERAYRPNQLLGKDVPHPIIGYYGGIADWFDVELMVELARARPQWMFVLIGGVFRVDISALESLPNVRMLGQQPYETMPLYLYHFDVCIIPFKINAVTEATDPVKFYEYISQGKPVVATPMPELGIYSSYLYLAADAAGFASCIDQALAENPRQTGPGRRALAREHTWQARCHAIAGQMAKAVPRASIVIITYNNLVLTRLCIDSLLRNTEHPNHEIIIVDNASSDGTQAYLRYLADRHAHIRVILNTENTGFAAGNNQGLRAAEGEHLILMNNDTIAPPGWLSRLTRHLGDPFIGLVGPMSNFVGNEAKVDVAYRTLDEMDDFARKHTWKHDGEVADIDMLAMQCVAFRRDLLERVGFLDERFGIGMFEDDDYAERVRAAGLRVVCAADVFIHHFGQASFSKLIQSGDYDPLFNRNRALFEEKWGKSWTPHVNGTLNFQPHL